MAIELPPLPYAQDALAPHISAETLDFHYGKHHAAYAGNLNGMIEGTDDAGKDLDTIIMESDGGKFNNAAQIWNHSFYWNCMKSGGGGTPSGALAEAIDRDFGSFDKFATDFKQAAMTQFGSGWAWLAQKDGKLEIQKTANAGLPMKHGDTALLTCDVWEHAYYIDYRNARATYVDTFLAHLVNWDFVASNMA